ncbi:lytic transglycosylase domain-containing protein [Bradyrhizobium erythrophlei]|uniref:lytic transglycosylase domain-containing protein n=1 Tax=Bradyrhizobium erythrophlei TaxID=1437360 RepID=UPI0035E499CA
MRSRSLRSAIPLFDRLRAHSSVPANDRGAVARSGGPERPNGRREAALPWTDASTTACLRLLGACFRLVRPPLFVLTICASAAVVAKEATAQRTSGQARTVFAGFIAEASQRFAVPVRWISSVIRLESAGDVRAKSPKGAMGLMQIMPNTWADLRLRYGLGNDPYDARDNILAGTAYLGELYDRYGLPGTFAAYNAGPARYEKHLAGDPLPAETQAYVANLATLLEAESVSIPAAGSRSWAASPIFLAHSERASTPDRQQGGRASDSSLTATGTHELSALVPKATGLFVARSDVGGRR